MDQWHGKTAIVTGASSGIGYALAKILAENGLKVAALGRRLENLHKLENEVPTGTLKGLKCDITCEDEILSSFEWVFENWGPVHILVNNAGVCCAGMLTNFNTKDWEMMFATNVIGLSVCSREAIKSMKSGNIKGHIINIGSGSGHGPNFVPGIAGYSATKNCVTVLSSILQAELVRENTGIKVTNLSPGLTVSEMSDAFLKEVKEEIPILQTEDVVNAVLYTLSTPPHVNIATLIVVPTNRQVITS